MPGPHRCPWATCGSTFTRKADVKRHMKFHIGEYITCPFCDYKSTQMCHVQKHVRVHTGEKPYTCYERDVKDPSQLCCKPFGDDSSHRRHLKMVHGVITKNPRKKTAAPSTPSGDFTSGSEGELTAAASYAASSSVGLVSPATTATTPDSSPHINPCELLMLEVQLRRAIGEHVGTLPPAPQEDAALPEGSFYRDGTLYVPASSSTPRSNWDDNEAPSSFAQGGAEALLRGLNSNYNADSGNAAEWLDPRLL